MAKVELRGHSGCAAMAYAGVMPAGFRSDLRMIKPGLRLSGAWVGNALAQAWIAGSSRSPDRQRSAAGLLRFQPGPEGLNAGTGGCTAPATCSCACLKGEIGTQQRPNGPSRRAASASLQPSLFSSGEEFG